MHIGDVLLLENVCQIKDPCVVSTASVQICETPRSMLSA